MQHMAKSNKNQNGNSQVQSIIITAITLFALAGAILGFSVGALTHHSASTAQTTKDPNKTADKNGNTKKPNQGAVKQTPTPTPTAPVVAVPLGYPVLGVGTPLTGAYKYTYSLQAIDKDNNQPITTNGVTCRIWLAKAKGNGPLVEDNDIALFKNASALQQALPNESAGLTFDSATPQTQPCVNGVGKWNVNLSSTIPKGTYYIVGLTENGTYINWSWSGQIKIPLQ
jgi:hypothetical protein